jgi:hypothetical protein
LSIPDLDCLVGAIDVITALAVGELIARDFLVVAAVFLVALVKCARYRDRRTNLDFAAVGVDAIPQT